MDADDFTYANGYRSSDSSTEFIEGTTDEIINAMEKAVAKNNQFAEIIIREDNFIVIKTIHFNKLLKRVLRVSLIGVEERNGYLVRVSTMNYPSQQPSGLSRKLIIETLKELGREEQAKEFSKESNREELKSFGMGIARGALSIVKIVIFFIIILLIIGVIGMIF